MTALVMQPSFMKNLDGRQRLARKIEQRVSENCWRSSATWSLRRAESRL